MADGGREWTDARLEELTARIKDEYSRALEAMQRAEFERLQAYERQLKYQRERLEDGKITEGQFKKWQAGKAAELTRMQGMTDELAQIANRSNEAAARMVADELPTVFAENANWSAFYVDQSLGKVTGFDVVNRDAVRRLMMDDPDLLPNVIIDKAKDIAWNRQKFSSAVTQAVLLGESVEGLTARIQDVTGSNEAHARMLARTAFTSAENGGREHTYERARRNGVEVVDVWMATLDSRTRDSHILMDGEERDPGTGLFPNGLRYPGDPSGPPEEVCNCFVGKTLFKPCGEVLKSYKHRQSALFAFVNLACGIELACTPNHPVLTPDGWVGIGSLHEGDDIFIARFDDDMGAEGNPNVDHAFTRADALHELMDVLASERATVLQVDFHGDVSTSEVEIVAKERFLLDDGDASGAQSGCEVGLELADALAPGDGTFLARREGIVHATAGGEGGGGVRLPFVGCERAHSQVHALGAPALRDAVGVEDSDDGATTAREVCGELLHRFGASEVRRDHIVRIDIRPYDAQVYNLQTESGYYAVAGNSTDSGYAIIAHNCRCYLDGRVEGFKRDFSDLSMRWGDLPEGATYEEWKRGEYSGRGAGK